ncbi:hypothetical protein [Streptacidiphilus sp. P02-A3a]|uniref:hypothetical protein n=1 Tax=Streptacidiphilus sp. P02-A3a TaxID=2704468 RepID=UPI0015FC26C0|nr:hypothetical protein [Streptacidiphilus sp. P02-A3a]QMU66993.1 hypothetical protein GXP74_00960 [Streptacidiphilus sp. P02-A3a]
MLRTRTAIAAVSFLALSGLYATPAQADPPSRGQLQVDAFFSQYLTAVNGQNQDQTPVDVRNEFLTAQLNQQLDQYQQTHNADPVFRAQNTPVSWSTQYGGSGAGHTTVILTENWAGGQHTQVWYQVELSDLTIDGLEDPPPPPA